ncbi:MAG TPA: hypothetical protein VHE59_10325 [Mucilaginibacter sp.]|nr:hypothetical protein [Mucilaginibacter sp.]
MSSQLIANIANIALAVSVIVALIFGLAQVRAAARDRRERLTLEVLRQFQTHEFAELMHFINTYKVPATYNDMRTAPAEDQVKLIQFSQQMESLGMIVAERLINIDLVDKTLGSYVTTSWEKYKVLFLEIRETAPDPFLGEYFQWLAEAIDKRMQEKPREPFYVRG